MHLEDRLQELYFKSRMLSEYLKGQMRVHVKELGVVLGYAFYPILGPVYLFILNTQLVGLFATNVS